MRSRKAVRPVLRHLRALIPTEFGCLGFRALGFGVLGICCALLPEYALASHVTMSGDSVDLTAPCMGQVNISIDGTLKNGASLDSNNSTQVTMRDDRDGAESKITIATRNCAPNGKLSLHLAPDTGLSIHDSHDSHFRITGTLSSLEASLDSDMLDMEHVQSLDLSLHGNSNVHIGFLERAAQIVASGTSTFTAENAQLSALSAQLTNNTALSINNGTIEALTIVTADQATATILGSATVATVTVNGSGVVNIEKVTGPIVRSGSGSLRVGAPNGEIYRPTTPPPSTPPATPQSQTPAALLPASTPSGPVAAPSQNPTGTNNPTVSPPIQPIPPLPASTDTTPPSSPHASAGSTRTDPDYPDQAEINLTGPSSSPATAQGSMSPPGRTDQPETGRTNMPQNLPTFAKPVSPAPETPTPLPPQTTQRPTTPPAQQGN